MWKRGHDVGSVLWSGRQGMPPAAAGSLPLQIGDSVRGVLPKSISASDVGQTFLSAGSGDFPVPGFRVKLSALVREVGKLRNRQARKPTLPFGQHALKLRPKQRKLLFSAFAPA